MNRIGFEGAAMFVGPEVEHTPAYSKKTLFVVGKQPVQEIIKNAKISGAPHIFMGANHSFVVDIKDEYWDKTITELLDRGFWVTLDYQAHEHEIVLKMLNPGIWQSRIFVPLLGVRIANFAKSSPNLTVKIDDIDFNATNEGVWCFQYRELMDSNRFTDWGDYGTDSVITDEAVQTKVVAKSVVKTATVEQVDNTPITQETLNNTEVGLDTEPTTALKPEVNESVSPQVSEIVNTPEDAAAAYAEGATADPVAEESVKKTKGKKV